MGRKVTAARVGSSLVSSLLLLLLPTSGWARQEAAAAAAAEPQGSTAGASEPAAPSVPKGSWRDPATGLLWTTSGKKTDSWLEAKLFCELHTGGGYDDWQLPAVQVLATLYQAKQAGGIGINGLLWTATGRVKGGAKANDTGGDPGVAPMFEEDSLLNRDDLFDPVRAGEVAPDTEEGAKVSDAPPYETMLVDFASGGVQTEAAQALAVCVRSTAEAPPAKEADGRFTDLGDGTVQDGGSDLLWTREDTRLSLDWGSAESYCQRLRTGGQGGWRLPTLDELGELRDKRQSGARKLSPAFRFVGLLAWSDTKTFAGEGTRWAVGFDEKRRRVPLPKGEALNVHAVCVRADR